MKRKRSFSRQRERPGQRLGGQRGYQSLRVFNAVQWRKRVEVQKEAGGVGQQWGAMQLRQQEQEAGGDFQRFFSSCWVEGGLCGIMLPKSGDDFAEMQGFLFSVVTPRPVQTAGS